MSQPTKAPKDLNKPSSHVRGTTPQKIKLTTSLYKTNIVDQDNWQYIQKTNIPTNSKNQVHGSVDSTTSEMD